MFKKSISLLINNKLVRLKKKKRGWTGIWWKNPKLRYPGVITKPPIDKSSKRYRFWKKCAWALIYNPNTPIWLRVILQEQVQYRRPFNKVQYKKDRWLRLFYRNWSKKYIKFYSLKKRARWAKVYKYHRAYKTVKNLHNVKLGVRISRLGTKGASNYFNTFIDYYRRSLFRLKVTRQRRRKRPTISATRYTSNIYTIKYIRNTQFSLLLSNFLSKKYSTRTTFFNNILPTKTLKKFLLSAKTVSWKKTLISINFSMLRFLYKNNISLNTFSYFTAVAKGLILVNNKKVDIRHILSVSDIIVFKKSFLFKKLIVVPWSITQSWLFWLKSYYQNLQTATLLLQGKGGIIRTAIFYRWYILAVKHKKEIYKPFFSSPKKQILETGLRLYPRRKILRLSIFRPELFRRKRWLLLRNRKTISDTKITASYVYTYKNPVGPKYNVIKLRERSLFKFVFFLYK